MSVRVIHYCRSVEGEHSGQDISEEIFYVPDLEIVLYKSGGMSGSNYGFTRNHIILDEAEMMGTNPILEKVDTGDGTKITFGIVFDFEYDSTKIEKLIELIKTRNKAESKLEEGIKKISKAIIR